MIESGEIHLWRVSLEPGAADLSVHEALLTGAERERARRISLAKVRRQFIISHGRLRALLGQYLDADPLSFEFVENEHGKPHLADPQALHFNLSHAHQLAVIALARDVPVGVDVEFPREDRDLDGIARRTFAPGELAIYESLSPDDRTAAFLNAWTRKEAFVKAIGDGFQFPLADFEVSLRPGEPARLLSVRGDETAAAGWTLKSFEPAGGYIGAVAAPEADMRIVLGRD